MTKHDALREHIEETRRVLLAERRRLLRDIEMAEEALHEVMQEFKQLPSEEQVWGRDSFSYQELAEATERFGIPVPDALLVEDDNDDGTQEVTK